ncbi:MAG TPA: tetratricopeptide repeat protein [Chthoniobacteraceae bacterium]|jgi:tetratricopeptide (TPR) repeat protein|nr:repeat protein [Chthoniobacter sp.]HEV7868273.1 tetratricopeptide repeat protein [Chthoniobacteraceae bacterium]
MWRHICWLLLLTSGLAAAQAPRFRIGPAQELNEPGRQTPSAEAQQISKRALTAFARGDLVAAREDFQRVLNLVPGNLPTMINLGLLEYRTKQYGEAERQMKKVIQTNIESGLGWLILGVIYYDQNKLDAALGALSQAVFLEPKDARAHHYLGVTIGRKGWYSGAEDEMRKAIALAPDYAEAHFNLAVFYLQRSPPAVELARRHYQQARDLGAAPDPDVEKSLVEPKE